MRTCCTFLFLSLACALHAQYLANGPATFVEGPQRTEIGPRQELIARFGGMPCWVVVNITVNRKGRVVSAALDHTTVTCTDHVAERAVLKAAKELKFNPAPEAPAAQHGLVTWADIPAPVEAEPRKP